ncbi:hypothetical protein [Candidatus Poriferisodalis sp.]|uniref:hypothetical protein n=1 Tax=Candidatus Poriferisodalis sp. TaxID=3101277 RepID=UPI003B010859
MSLLIAAGVPAAVGAAWWMSRRSPMAAVADSRGIALQTVIVIVVMLVIAGGVAAVLFTRGSEAIGDLEDQAVGGVNAGNCTLTQLKDDLGKSQAGTLDPAPPARATHCRFTASAVNISIDSTSCVLVGGTVTTTASATAKGVCSVEF